MHIHHFIALIYNPLSCIPLNTFKAWIPTEAIKGLVVLVLAVYSNHKLDAHILIVLAKVISAGLKYYEQTSKVS